MGVFMGNKTYSVIESGWPRAAQGSERSDLSLPAGLSAWPPTVSLVAVTQGPFPPMGGRCVHIARCLAGGWPRSWSGD